MTSRAGSVPAQAARRIAQLFQAAPPIDADAARAYGRIYAAVTAAGRDARGARAVDLMIAAVACSVELPLDMRNPSDFAALDGLVDIVAI